MDASGAAFANQLMYFSNPSIQTIDQREFDDPKSVEFHPYSHEASTQAYLPKHKRSDIGRFKYQKDKSTKNIAVYKSSGRTPQEKKLLFGYRGTASKRDVLTDAALTAGLFKHTRHANEVLTNFDNVRKYYPRHSIHLAGHSLGTVSSNYVAHSRPKSINSQVLFNPPGSIPGVGSGIIKKFYKTKTQKNVEDKTVNLINLFDPVSTLSKGRKNTKYRYQPGLHVHDLNQWNDDR